MFRGDSALKPIRSPFALWRRGQEVGRTSPSMALTTRFKSYGCFAMTVVNLTLKRAARSHQRENKHVSAANTYTEVSGVILTNPLQKHTPPPPFGDQIVLGNKVWKFICLTHNSGLISAVIFSCIMGSLLQVLLWEICTHSNMASMLSSYLFSLEVTKVNIKLLHIKGKKKKHFTTSLLN